MSTQFDPAEYPLPHVPPAEASGSDALIDPLNDEAPRASEREQHTTGSVDELPVAPRTRRPRATRAARTTRAARAEQPDTTPDGILHLPVCNEAQPGEQCEESDEAAVVAELEAQGFTADEAIRLIHASNRVATLHAVESEPALRRLRFARWLVEHGMLDEFSA